MANHESYVAKLGFERETPPPTPLTPPPPDLQSDTLATALWRPADKQ